MSSRAFHPAADLFPLIEGEDFESLAESIRKGFNPAHPITLHPDGSILDGRNRYLACIDAGIAPITITYAGDTDPDSLWEFVKNENWDRRHLTPDIKYGVRRKAKTWIASLKADAAKRKAEGQAKGREKQAENRGSGFGNILPKPPRDHAKEDANRTAARIAKEVGSNRSTIAVVEKAVDKNEDLADAFASGKAKFADVVREEKRASIRAKLEDIESNVVKAAEGVYDVIVIDPPWPMQKIARDVRPNQSEMPYPTMTEAEMDCVFEIPGSPQPADDCHVWTWTTHKHLPMAFRLLQAWRFKYVCTFVWHKPGGFQPVGLPQYNCEFALYARRGAPKFIDTKALPTCFQAPRGAHSEKPGEFYATVRRVTAGRRADMFQRKPHEGFDGWGNES